MKKPDTAHTHAPGSDDITCPSCGYQFPLEDALRDSLKQQLGQELQQERDRLLADRRAMDEEKARYEDKLKEEEKAIEARLRDAMNKRYKDEVGKKEEELKQRFAERQQDEERRRKEEQDEWRRREKEQQDAWRRQQQEQQEEFLRQQKDQMEQNAANQRKLHQQQLDALQADLKRAEEDRLKLAQLETDFKLQGDRLRAELAQQNQQQLQHQLEEQKRALEAQAELKQREYEEKLRQQQEQVALMQKKLDQGSMQAQGEAQELVLQDWLEREFGADTIEEVGKGVRGADVMQRVLHQGRDCGLILYESKNTQTWNEDWITKLKEDGRSQKAAALILVTQAMPKGLDTAHWHDGVWVCRMPDLRLLAHTVRQGLLQLAAATASQTNKGTKMELLYDYLCSPDFVNNITNALEALHDMRASLDKEKQQVLKRLAEREKQIERVVGGLNAFYGSVQGISGGSVARIALLEDPDDTEDGED